MNTRAVGTRGEQRAASYLQRLGWRLLAKNFRCRRGEIDLIAWDTSGDKPYLVFVEVKYRKTSGTGHPEEFLTLTKRKTISRVADFYRVRYRVPADTPCRFDVIAIEGETLRHIPHAFWYLPPA